MHKRETLNKICAYCEYACTIYDEDAMLCQRRGVVSKGFHCKKFSYDPLKHQPTRSAPAPKLDFVDIDAVS